MVCGRRVELPVKSRNARRIVERLTPEKCGSEYVLIICRGLEGCRRCVLQEEPEVKIRRVWVDDPLSGLRSRLPVVEAWYEGRLLWRTVWKHGLMIVERIEC